MRWGLVPAWSKEPRTEFATFNARAESVAEKPAFRTAFRHRRCLIAADGFFEWARQDGRKQPHYIQLASEAPFAFAGIWEHWTNGDQSLNSCSIIVTVANDLVGTIHDRMPVILSPAHYDQWLDPRVTRPDQLKGFLAPYPSFLMTMRPVTSAVNSPRNDSCDLLNATGPL